MIFPTEGEKRVTLFFFIYSLSPWCRVVATCWGKELQMACLHQKPFKVTRSITPRKMPWGTLMTLLCFPLPLGQFFTTNPQKALHFKTTRLVSQAFSLELLSPRAANLSNLTILRKCKSLLMAMWQFFTCWKQLSIHFLGWLLVNGSFWYGRS